MRSIYMTLCILMMGCGKEDQCLTYAQTLCWKADTCGMNVSRTCEESAYALCAEATSKAAPRCFAELSVIGCDELKQGMGPASCCQFTRCE